MKSQKIFPLALREALRNLKEIGTKIFFVDDAIEILEALETAESEINSLIENNHRLFTEIENERQELKDVLKEFNESIKIKNEEIKNLKESVENNWSDKEIILYSEYYHNKLNDCDSDILYPHEWRNKNLFKYKDNGK